MNIKFTDIGFVTDDVLRLCAFYQSIFGGTVDGDKSHTALRLDGMSSFQFKDPDGNTLNFRTVAKKS